PQPAKIPFEAPKLKTPVHSMLIAVTLVQPLPSNLSRLPPSPMAYASLNESVCTFHSLVVVTSACGSLVHVPPFHRSTVPRVPTARMLTADEPEIPNSVSTAVRFVVSVCQMPLVHRYALPLAPTMYTSVALAAQTPKRRVEPPGNPPICVHDVP